MRICATFFLLLGLVCASPHLSPAAATPGGDGAQTSGANKTQAPDANKGMSKTRVVSEKMTHDSGKNVVVFEGKVHVTRPDMEIWSETLTFLLEGAGKKTAASPDKAADKALGGMGGGKVEKIIAEKNVRFKQENKTGSCGKATYYLDLGKIVMEEEPVLVDGENRIRGRIINYYTETGISEVIGNVDVVFSTDDKAKIRP
ncbi:hypothetical protein FACS1894206_07420 [Deltaproteobacteria bacterium]|nr:hypothetical protein FACS1894206_07420 [Deltaproteobacteria bacterium]